jgi:hypothetical protein
MQQSIAEPGLRLVEVSERPLRLGDNPSIDVEIALLVQAFNTYMETTNKALMRIESKVDLTNGSVAKVTARQDMHDRHHGPADSALAGRLEARVAALNEAEAEIKRQAALIADLASAEHDAGVRHKERMRLLGVFVGGVTLVPAFYAAFLVLQEMFG